MQTDEKHIIAGLKTGSEISYKYIFDTYYIYLCKVAYEYVHDYFTAKSLVSDVIFHIWEKRADLEIVSLKHYLVQSVCFHALNYLKKESAHGTLSIDGFLVNMNAMESDSHPLSELIDEELNNRIELLLEALPLQCRQVFFLSRFENLKYDDIATRLGLSVNTVKYHIKNALSKLKSGLSDYMVMFVLAVILFFC